MTVYLLIDKEGNVKRVYAREDRAKEDLEVTEGYTVTAFEVIGGRTREARPRKKQAVTAS